MKALRVVSLSVFVASMERVGMWFNVEVNYMEDIVMYNYTVIGLTSSQN